MAMMSIFQGYYTLGVYKIYGYTQEALSDDCFLSKVGSVSALMGAMRFLWSGSMDKIEVNAFKKVYGALLILQTLLGSSIGFAS